MDTHAGAPFCHVCQHYHEQGSKCPICGHSGKANIYKKMRVRHNCPAPVCLCLCLCALLMLYWPS